MKVLIVEDHPIVRSGLRRMIASEPEMEIRDVATGEEALGVFGEFRPDLVVLDLSLPGASGLEVIRRLKGISPDARVLVLSMHDSPIFVTRALQAGALGYVSKNAPPDEILNAIKRVADGEPYIENALAQEMAIAQASPSPQRLGDLSPRDLEILRLLGEGRTLLQIADAIGASYKTVANRCTRLKVKLGADRTADLIRIAILNGISGGERDAPLPSAKKTTPRT